MFCLPSDGISDGKTNLLYNPPSKDQLQFGRNQEVTILSKPVDKDSKAHWIGRVRFKIKLRNRSLFTRKASKIKVLLIQN